MKVRVSIPDPLFRDAEKTSRRLGMPRSELYSRALEAYLPQHTGGETTARMNAALVKVGPRLDPGWEIPGIEVLRRQ